LSHTSLTERGKLKKIVKAAVRILKKIARAAKAVAKAAYKYSGAQDVVSCVTHPGLASCAKAAVTVALVAATGGEGEVEIAAADAAEGAGADAAENAATHTAEDATSETEDTAESCVVGGKSFTADTLVLLASGKTVPISQLKPGEKVLANNPKSGITKAETISVVMLHYDTNLYDLQLRSGTRTAVIETTTNHPFWDLTTRAWTDAARLRPGDHLRSPAGRYATVSRGWAPRQHTGWMWDLTIPGDHDFYVVTSAAATLVHNADPCIKPGSSGGETAGKRFPQSVKDQALQENPDTCVYCGMKTDSPQVDHSIPRSRGGNATLENAQTACSWCNASKGNRDFPVNPPPGYRGQWPPGWW
jgi:hypothetical protein